MKKCWIKRVLIVSLLVLAAYPLPAKAAEENGINFTVQAVIPENQTDSRQSYFDLLIEPGMVQTVQIQIKNTSPEDIVVEIGTATASTNMNGVVEYAAREDLYTPDNTLLYHIEDIVKTETEVSIPAGHSYLLDIEIHMPEDEFPGVIAGGIVLKQQENGEEGQVADEARGVQIQNEYQYAMALVLSNGNKQVDSELVLNEVYAGQLNFKNVIYANLQNIKPKFMNVVNVDARVSRQGKSEVIYEHSDSSLQMAPNSNFDFILPLNGQRFTAGDYHITLAVESKGETWVLEKDFRITAEEAKRLNAADLSIEGFPMWMYIAAGAVCLSLAFVILLSIKRARIRKKARFELEEKIKQQLLNRG